MSPASSLSLEPTDLLLREMFLWCRHLKEPAWVVGEHKQLYFTPGPFDRTIGDEGCEVVKVLFSGTVICCNSNLGLGTSGACTSPTFDCSVIFDIWTPLTNCTNLYNTAIQSYMSEVKQLFQCNWTCISGVLIFYPWFYYLLWLVNAVYFCFSSPSCIF